MPKRLKDVNPWDAVRVRPNSLVWNKKVHRPTRVVTEFHCTITPAIITWDTSRCREERGEQDEWAKHTIFVPHQRAPVHRNKQLYPHFRHRHGVSKRGLLQITNGDDMNTPKTNDMCDLLLTM